MQNLKYISDLQVCIFLEYIIETISFSSTKYENDTSGNAN